MAAKEYHVRWRGQVSGPFEHDELKLMATQGRVSKLHDVSTDQTEWQRAASLADLFPPIEVRSTVVEQPTPAETEEPALAAGEQHRASSADAAGQEPEIQLAEALAPPDARQWHHARQGVVAGPHTTDQILRLIAEGELTGDDHVCLYVPEADADAYEEWQPVPEVAEFQNALASHVGEQGPGDPDELPEVPTADGARLASMAVKLGWIGLLIPICGVVGLIMALQVRQRYLEVGEQEGADRVRVALVLGIIDSVLDVIRIAGLIFMFVMYASPSA